MSFDFNVWTGESDYALLSSQLFHRDEHRIVLRGGWGKGLPLKFYDTPGSKSKSSIAVPDDHPMTSHGERDKR